MRLLDLLPRTQETRFSSVSVCLCSYLQSVQPMDHHKSLSLSVCLFLSLSSFSVCLSVCLSTCLSLSIYLSVGRSVSLSVYLSDYIFLCLYVCRSVCLSVCLPACLSVFLCTKSFPICLDENPVFK